MALEQFFDRETEPAPRCRYCEYFDGGGFKADGQPVNFHGDCLNQASRHFTTTVNGSCKQFFPCSTRWPDTDHD